MAGQTAAVGLRSVKRYLNQQLKIRQLRAVAAIASQGSLLSASQALGISQPALSKALREVEDLLGVRIFERHARGVVPNDHGRLVADAADQILRTLRELEDGFDRLDEHTGGSVVVGAMPTAAAGVMPDVVRRLKATDPNIDVRVIEDRTDELRAMLMLGDVDLVVGRLYPGGDEDERLIRTELYDEPMSMIAGRNHPLAALPSVTPADIAAYDLSMPISSLRIHADSLAYLETYGIAPGHAVSTTSLTFMRELLLACDLITVMPRLMLVGDILRGDLRVLRLAGDGRPPPRPAGITYRAERPLRPPALRLAEQIASYSREVLAKTEP